ncbi:YeiH family protein [Cystobacter fuscus]
MFQGMHFRRVDEGLAARLGGGIHGESHPKNGWLIVPFVWWADGSGRTLPPMDTSLDAPRRNAAHVLIPLGAALSVLPFVSAGLALLAGLGVALLLGNPHVDFTRKVTHPLLSLAVVGLGAGMDLREVLAVGARGALSTVVSIGVCLLLGTWLARALGVQRETGLLISIGTAICGGSAIAAVVPVLRPREQEVSVALGTVFLLNAVALFVFPPLGHAVGLDAHQFGLWSALAIHDTSSVVGAALRYAPEALDVAAPVKLARALWIVPLTLALGAWRHRRDGTASQGQRASPGSSSASSPRRRSSPGFPPCVPRGTCWPACPGGPSC